MLVRIDKEGKVKYVISELKRGCSTCQRFKEVDVDPTLRVQTKLPIKKDSVLKLPQHSRIKAQDLEPNPFKT